MGAAGARDGKLEEDVGIERGPVGTPLRRPAGIGDSSILVIRSCPSRTLLRVRCSSLGDAGTTNLASKKDTTMTSIILASMFLLNDPTGAGGPVCDDAQETIDALEAELAAYERTVEVLDDVFFDFYLASDPSGGTAAGCENRDPGLDTDICECIANNNEGHANLTLCITARQGGPTGGL